MVKATETQTINLKPNISDLQADILDLLKDISCLMAKAQQELGDRDSESKYANSQAEIKQAIYNVEHLELRMAIVAPMKAGKSTIINAIVGQDLLPSRNAAMTTIPTKISFDDSVDRPTLKLSKNTLEVFQTTWFSLHHQINHLSKLELDELISQYPHLSELAEKIKSDRFYIPAEISGKENISLVLTQLNDLVRLCCALDPTQDPLNQLEDVPLVQTPFWRNNDTEESKQIGNLVIVDTPGPNEAGDNLRLTAVVEQELKRCAIVLIVLDFTQLNNQAAEAVKRQVQPIVDVIGKDNLYVLVNKVDQRLAGDMTSEEVKKFIYSDLDLSESSDSERINLSIETNIKGINDQIEQYLDLDFKQSVDNYFSELDIYLSNYRRSLKQAQNDGQLDIKKKERLVSDLQYFIPESTKQLDRISICQMKVEQLD